MWGIEVTDQFLDWWGTVTDQQQEALTDRIHCSCQERLVRVGGPARRHLYDEYVLELRED